LSPRIRCPSFSSQPHSVKNSALINSGLYLFVVNTVADFKHEFEKKGLELQTRIQEQFVPVQADVVRIAQIIGNLLSNSLKFTPKGGTVLLELA
jgi:signal transduction histidine kinase